MDIDAKLALLRKNTNLQTSHRNAAAPSHTRIRYQRMCLLDVSLSMNGEKLTVATQAMDSTLRPDDGVLVFGSEVHHVDRRKLRTITSFGMTAMLPALSMAVEFYPSEIILITDGDPNVGGDIDKVIEWVAGISGIVINTIGIGRDVNSAFLQTIAEMTGGTYGYCDDPRQLQGAILMLENKKAISL